MGVALRQLGERTVRRCTADRPAVGVGAMRQDRDQPPIRQPVGGQQLSPESRIELDGGMETSTPRADVNGAVGIAFEDRREACWRLAQRCRQRVMMLGGGEPSSGQSHPSDS